MAVADLFTFSSSALPSNVVLSNFRMVEAISAPFELAVHFSTTTPDDIDLKAAIGAQAEIVADRGSGGPTCSGAGSSPRSSTSTSRRRGRSSVA